MTTPIFFHHGVFTAGTILPLVEDTAKHIVQVLRMKEGDAMRLANGKGAEVKATIATTGKKACSLKIDEVIEHPAASYTNAIAISTLKNHSRLEWFLEKATELGINEFILLNCTRTERTQFKEERWRNIFIAAMLQSQQFYLPILTEPVSLQTLFSKENYTHKYIAHCEEDAAKLPLAGFAKSPGASSLVLIGPEGDFTIEEIKASEQKGCVPVSLGSTRLRTETAGLYAAFCLVK